MSARRPKGLSVHVWTVNDPALAAHLARQGAASVISDDVSVTGPAIREVTGALSPLDLAPGAVEVSPAVTLTPGPAGH